MRPDLIPADKDGSIARVLEECREVVKAILYRFGETPTDGKTGIKYDNIEDLKNELSDLKDSIFRLEKFL